MTNKLLTSRALGAALCKHLGLDPSRVQSDYRISTDRDGLATVDLTIMLTAADLCGIGRAASEGEAGAELVNFTYNEVGQRIHGKAAL